jgi:PIN domain nuclease of toxin-antitoxin system
MSYLVDAHALIWHRDGDARLPRAVRQLLGDGDERLYISDATFWELTIKHSLGKLTLVGGLESLHHEWIGQEVAVPLPIEWRHIRRVGELPILHGDPFDRMLVAQALCEGLSVVTGDPQIHQYPGLNVFWK